MAYQKLMREMKEENRRTRFPVTRDGSVSHFELRQWRHTLDTKGHVMRDDKRDAARREGRENSGMNLVTSHNLGLITLAFEIFGCVPSASHELTYFSMQVGVLIWIWGKMGYIEIYVIPLGSFIFLAGNGTRDKLHDHVKRWFLEKRRYRRIAYCLKLLAGG
ncbi:hypothetical protein CPC08DRAFT_724995 [Agrocybe pediades]|nr:hypothetical protein CPC08DRAFT_724995 [Agrocybe pediades]